MEMMICGTETQVAVGRRYHNHNLFAVIYGNIWTMLNKYKNTNNKETVNKILTVCHVTDTSVKLSKIRLTCL